MKRTISLRALLFVPSAVFVLAILGIAYLSAVKNHRTAILGLARQWFLVNEESINRGFEALLNQPQEVTEELAGAVPLQGTSVVQIGERLRAVLRSRTQIDYGAIALTPRQQTSSTYLLGRTNQGQLFNLPITLPSAAKGSPAVPEFHQVDRPTWHLLPLPTPEGTVTRALVHIRPLGDRQGVVSAGVTLLRLQAVLERLMNRRTGYIAVIDRDGQMIAAANGLPDTPRGLGIRDGAEGTGRVIPQSASVQVMEATINGQPSFIYEAPLSIADIPWRVVMVVPMTEFAERVDSEHDRLLFFAAGALTVGLVLSVGVGRLIIHSIRQLQVIHQRLREGELHEPLTLPVKELQSLAEGWHLVSSRIWSDMRELQAELTVFFKQEAILNGVFENDGTVLKVNGAWENLLGYSEDALIGRHLLDLFHPEDRERTLAAYRQIQSPPHLLEKFVNRCVDVHGNYHYLEWHATGIDSRIHASIRDVTAQVLAEQNCQESEERLKMFSALSPAQIYILVMAPNGNLSYEFISQAVEQIYEYSVAEVQRNPDLMQACIYPEDRPYYELYLNACLSALSDYDYEWRIITPSEKIKWIRARSHPVRRQNGDVAWYGVVEDITRQKLDALVLRDSERRLQMTLSLNFLGSWDWNPITNEVYWSDQKYLLLGIAPTESARYESFMAVLHPEDRDRVREAITHAMAAGETYDCEFRVVHPDGTVHWLHERGECHYENGRAIRMLGIVYEVSDRKLMELELARQSEMLVNIFEAATDLMCIVDSHGHLLKLNPSWERVLGYPLSTLLGQSFLDFIHPDDRDLSQAALGRLNQKRSIPLLTNRYLTADGSLRWIEWRGVWLQDGSIYGVGRDITERKRLELELEDMEARLRAFLNHSSAVIYIKDLEGHYQWVNQELLRVLQITPEQVLGKSDADFFPTEKAQELRVLEVQVCAEKRTLQAEEVLPLADGDHTFFVTKFPLLRGGAPYAIGGICVDISDRIRAEADLRERESQLESFFSLSVDGFFFMMLDEPITWNDSADQERVLDYAMEHLRITKANQSFAAQYGCTVEQILSRGYAEFFADNLSAGRDALRQLFDNGSLRCQTQERTRDGRGVTIEGAYICLYDSQGRIRGHFGIQRDITEREQVKKELQRAKELAEQVARSKSAFLSNMSHEIRTPLNGVIGVTQILLDSQLSLEQRDWVKVIEESGEALMAVVNDILDFSKAESGQMVLECQPFSPAETLNSVDRILQQPALKRGNRVHIEVNQSVPSEVLGDRNRLRQILLNLIGNAIKFTESGTVTVSVTLYQEDSEGCTLLWTVQDTGVGIPAEYLQNLFQPFTQADASISRQFGGTGLGLAICHRLTMLMGGTIWVESGGNVGGTPPSHWQPQVVLSAGTTFYFTTRLSRVVSSVQECEALGTEVIHGCHTPIRILLVEDGEINQRIMQSYLRHFGYEAAIAPDGKSALDVLAQSPFDLIFMDMQMPDLDGIATTRLIRQNPDLNPQPYIVALTANSDEGDRQSCLEVGMNDFMSKPVYRDQLQQILRTYVANRLG